MRVNDNIVYNEMGNLIRSDIVINLIVYFQNTLKLDFNLKLSKMSQKEIFDANEIFKTNIHFFKQIFTSEADNTKEHIFSLIGGIVDKLKSFKNSVLRIFILLYLLFFNKLLFV